MRSLGGAGALASSGLSPERYKYPRHRRIDPMGHPARWRATLWSCGGGADGPELKHVDLPGGLVDVEAAKNQIAALTIVNFAAHQIPEKQLPPLKLGEWQTQITLPLIVSVVYSHDVPDFVLSRPSVRNEAAPS